MRSHLATVCMTSRLACQARRLLVQRQEAVAELQLGEAARFYPSDAALASWMAQADQGLAQIVYD